MKFDISVLIQILIALIPVVSFLMKINREIGEIKTDLKNIKEELKKQ